MRPLLYVKGMALQVREKERGCVRMLASLVAHAIGYKTIVGVHNIVHAQTRLAGFTVFTWYGKYRRLQYCKINVGAHNTIWVLTCLEGYIVPVWHGLVALSCRCASYGRVRSLLLRLI